MSVIRSLGLVIVALALVAGCGSPTTESRQNGSDPGTAVQNGLAGSDQFDFTAVTLEDEPFDGQSLAGRHSVLWFWTPWCPTCQREAPDVAAVAQANPEVNFVGVAAQDDVSAMRDFVSTYGVGSFPHLNDLDGAVWQRFGVTVQPAYAFVGEDGSVELVKHTLSEQELTERVDALSGS